MSKEISKYEKEINDYFEQIKQLCLKGFTDFVVLGIDVTGESVQIFNVGDPKGSVSNRDRIIKVVGELEDMKFNLQLSAYTDNECDNENDVNNESW